MKLHILAAAALILTGCDNDEDVKVAPTPAGCTTDKSWTIGPIFPLKGEWVNGSKGLPLNPCKTTEGATFTISPTAEPHYITKPVGNLTSKTKIRFTYKVTGTGSIYGAPGRTDACAPGQPSAITLYIKRNSDNWHSDGHRWWHQSTRTELTGPGEWTVEAPLNPAEWTSIQSMRASEYPSVWKETINNTEAVGFTFGNCAGSGHGALATAPMKFTITSFTVS